MPTESRHFSPRQQTWKGPDQHKTARRQAVDCERTNFVAALQAKNDRLSLWVHNPRLPSLRTMTLTPLRRFHVVLFTVGCAMKRPFQRCVCRGDRACSRWVRMPTFAVKSVRKGLKVFIEMRASSTRWRVAKSNPDQGNTLIWSGSKRGVLGMFLRDLFARQYGGFECLTSTRCTFTE